LELTDFLLSTPLSVDPVTIRHCEGEQRQITLSVNQPTCRLVYEAD